MARRDTYIAKLEALVPKSIDRLKAALDSDNEKLAVGAARYILDQVMGKPVVQAPESEGPALAAGTAAAILAATLRDQLSAPASTPQLPIVDGTVHILGDGATERGALSTSAAAEDFDA